MAVHRPVIRPELAEEIERRRGMVPFQAYVNELLRLALAKDRDEALTQVGRMVTQEVGMEPRTPSTPSTPTAEPKPIASKVPNPQGWRAPRRS